MSSETLSPDCYSSIPQGLSEEQVVLVTLTHFCPDWLATGWVLSPLFSGLVVAKFSLFNALLGAIGRTRNLSYHGYPARVYHS